MAYFKKVKPTENMKRFYRINMMPTLFGEWAVVREWGRIGSAGRVKEEWFVDREVASNAILALSAKRQKRGYRQVQSTG